MANNRQNSEILKLKYRSMNSSCQYNSININDVETNEAIMQKFNQLREELLGVLSDWCEMMYNKRVELQNLYKEMFGELEDELDAKSQNDAELQRRVDLLCMRMKAGERVSQSTLDSINKIIDWELSYKQKRKSDIQSGATFTSKQGNTTYTINMEMPEQKDLSGIYRKIVKHLHPDLVGESEAKKRYWNCVQSAYKAKNAEKLDMFRKNLCPEYISENATSQGITQLKRDIHREKCMIEFAKSQEPFIYEEKLGDMLWINEKRNQLYSQLNKLDKRIDHNSKIIKTLTAHI